MTWDTIPVTAGGKKMNATRTMTERQEQLNGMALGGIGTGTVEIRQNGCLEDWEIFNLGLWAAAEPEKNGKKELPDYDYDLLPFYIRTKEPGKEPVVRKLAHNRRIQGFRSVSYSFLKNVEEIRWTPQFPSCVLEYEDSGLPVTVTGEFASPIVPRDYKTSSMPGFYIQFSVENKSEKSQEISLLGTLKNPVNRGIKERCLRNRILQQKDWTTLLMDSAKDLKKEQSGSLALTVEGGEASWISGDYTEFFGAYVLGGELGISEESCMFGFRKTGALPNLGWQEKHEDLLKISEEAIDRASAEQVGQWLEELKMLASGFRPWKRLEEVRPDLAKAEGGQKKLLKILLKQYREFEQDPARGWGDGALCTRFELQPGERRQITFLLTWHFPHHTSINGNYVGHQYNRWCRDAGQVADFLMERRDQILSSVRRLSRVLDTCSAPPCYANSWNIQSDTLLKCSWWAENGDFGIWEGLGSCGFHTMDISYYGSFVLLAMFPELQLKQMRMGLPFQREDGRVHHFFRPDFETVDDGYDRVDMNPQFVLMVCRDFLWTGDRDYLKDMWEPVKKAMDSTELLDRDGDGLPDWDTRSNTYDAWRFRGTPSYIAGLWLGALSAAVSLAQSMGDIKRQEYWEQLYAKGKESFRRLWNGQYYSLWVDKEERDECLMSGQLDAEWYCRLLGILGYAEEEKTKKVLDQIWKHNYSKEGGLINASYPEGKVPTLYTYDNVQVESNWSGIEYALAGMYLENGRTAEAEALTQNVDSRYIQAGRMFNHEECGGHYYRPMAAWTLMLSLAGMKINKTEKRWKLVPKLQDLTVPWFTPDGYGVLRFSQGGAEILCEDGTADLEEIWMQDGFTAESVQCSGNPVEAVFKENRVRFKHTCRLEAGDTLKIYGNRKGGA